MNLKVSPCDSFFIQFPIALSNKIWNFLTTDLQVTTLSLDSRVSVLEENGGNGGNSSVAELEVRVETLEGTAEDHETRISSTEIDVNGE